MARLLSLLTLLTLIFPLSALAEEITVESKVTAATVYPDRAKITRTGSVTIPKGAHTLVFNGLPLNIFTDSLRVDGKASAAVTLGAVTHKVTNFEDFIKPQEKELNDLLITLQDQKNGLNAEKQALQIARTFLENIGKQAVLRENEEIAKMNLNPESWAQAADGLSLKMAENLKKSIEIDAKIRDVDAKIQKTQRDLRELRTGQKQSYTVMVPFEAEKETTLKVSLNYQANSAWWHPVYDARLDTQDGTLSLIQYANVSQRGGEDWEDITLTLSTAQPSRGTTLPDMYPQWVDIFKPQPAAMKRSMGGNVAATASVAMMDMAAAPMESFAEEVVQQRKEVDAVMQQSQIETNGYVGEYKITGPADVKSNGEQSKLLIGTFETETKLQIHVKSQFDSNAYLMAKTKLLGEAPILPGQVNLFRDGAFIGQGYFPMLRQGDEQTLGFGVDDNVTVARNTLADESGESGMIVKDDVIERAFVTKVKNLHKEAVEVVVWERAPVSKNENIKVQILKDKTTQGYEIDIEDKKGVARWTQTLQPAEEKQFNWAWKVSWPKGENISGL